MEDEIFPCVGREDGAEVTQTCALLIYAFALWYTCLPMVHVVHVDPSASGA